MTNGCFIKMLTVGGLCLNITSMKLRFISIFLCICSAVMSLWANPFRLVLNELDSNSPNLFLEGEGYQFCDSEDQLKTDVKAHASQGQFYDYSMEFSYLNNYNQKLIALSQYYVKLLASVKEGALEMTTTNEEVAQVNSEVSAVASLEKPQSNSGDFIVQVSEVQAYVKLLYAKLYAFTTQQADLFDQRYPSSN